MKIIVFSCNFGNYDRVFNPKKKEEGVRYILFTDKLNNCFGWEQKIINYKTIDGDPQRAARFIKTHPEKYLPKHEINIWADSCYQLLIENIKSFCLKNLPKDTDISLFKHPKRICLFEELNVCRRLNLDRKELFDEQKLKYVRDKIKTNSGLYHTALILRKSNFRTNRFNDLWWEEISQFSKRDQISFSYLLQRLKINLRVISSEFGDKLYNSPIVRRRKHIRLRVRYA
jgi:hypothetical protein